MHAKTYAAAMPQAFDLVHRRLGDDGHTASLVPNDPVLEVDDRDVALTAQAFGSAASQRSSRARTEARSRG